MDEEYRRLLSNPLPPGDASFKVTVSPREAMELADFTRAQRDGGGFYWDLVSSTLRNNEYRLKFDYRRGWVHAFLSAVAGKELAMHVPQDLVDLLSLYTRRKKKAKHIVFAVYAHERGAYARIAELDPATGDKPGLDVSHRMPDGADTKGIHLRDVDMNPWTLHGCFPEQGIMFFGNDGADKEFLQKLMNMEFSYGEAIATISFNIDKTE